MKIHPCLSLVTGFKSIVKCTRSQESLGENKNYCDSNKNIWSVFFTLLVGVLLVCSSSVHGQMQMEKLNRGLVAVRTNSNEVYIGWRLFGTDPSNIGFNIYRGSTKLNASPITASTNYVDNVSTNDTYTVKPVINGAEQAASESAGVWAQQYLQIPLQAPEGGTTPANENYTYNANDCSVGDVDGDGQYEIFVKWDPSNSKDNAQAGYTGNVYIDAYKINGTRLWRIDLGRNIRAGAHYTQFMVYDLDGDGKAEVACRTSDGTRDGKGTVIGNSSADYRENNGYVLSGPEFLTIFNGQTGAAMATTDYVPSRNPANGWGKTTENYNRVDRFIAVVAYLDGQRPSLVMGRGYYGRLVRAAWDWRGGKLTNRWTFDSNNSGNASYAGQGNHQMTVGDADGDGKQEVFNGSSAINDNGSGFWANAMGHGDALHMSDMDPDRPGLEIWMPYEHPPGNGEIGAALVDAKNGSRIFTVAEATADVGRGVAADIDSRHKGYECWAARGNLYNCKGTQIGTVKPSMNFAVWWDADLQRELLDNITISKWNPSTSSASTMLSASGCSSNNSTKATPNLSADLYGDWREEVMWRTADNKFLRIYTTTIPATNRIYTLMHDPQYRVAIAWQNGAYNQPPHPGFYLGGGMATPPTPNIVLVGGTTPNPGTSLIIQENTTGFCSVDGTVDSNNAGYTGSGFANTNNAIGAGVSWKVNTPSSGSYTLSWNFANGSTTDRPVKLLVNGSTVVSSISFPSTSVWTTWTETSVTVNLPAGAVDIRLEATTANGTANIDYIKVGGNNPQAISCTTSARVAVNSLEESAPLLNNEVVAYPNPSKGSFQLKANGAFKYTIKDNSGNIREKGEGINSCIAGRNLIPGMYLIKVQTQKGSKNIKIIKQ